MRKKKFEKVFEQSELSLELFNVGMKACKLGHVDIIKKIIEVCPNYMFKIGVSEFFRPNYWLNVAVCNNNFEIVKLLTSKFKFTGEEINGHVWRCKYHDYIEIYRHLLSLEKFYEE